MLSHLHPIIASLLADEERLPAFVDVRFDTPTRAWTESLVQPTVCFYLFDIQENTEVRQTDMQAGRARGSGAWRAPARRFDLRYLVCAFSSEPDDEHTLIWHALAALLRSPQLPRDALPEEVRRLDLPVAAKVGKIDDAPRPLDLWGALELPPRPALLYTVTAPLDLEIAFAAPLVLKSAARYTRTTQADERDGRGVTPQHIRRDKATGEPTSGMNVVARHTHALPVVGTVRDAGGQPLAGASVSVVDRGLECVTDEQGRFTFPRVQPGGAQLRVRYGDGAMHTANVVVPSRSYDIQLG